MATPILHVDMDAFFASVEQRDHPQWRGKPVIVGSPPDQRGVVSTCSYEARRFGVHSAMPSRQAYQLCPQGIFVPGDHQKYSAVSRQIMAIFEQITPKVEQVSVDEAFLDCQNVRGIAQDPVAAAQKIRRRIREELQLTASVGVAPNLFLAKLGSDLHKPDGLTIVPDTPADIVAFLAPLPVGRIWGVGKKTAELLHHYGVTTIGQLQQMPPSFLDKLLGSYGQHLRELAYGIDHRQVRSEPDQEKSLSQEYTFLEDCTDLPLIRTKLLEQCERVGERLRRRGLVASLAFLKLRYGDFRTISRQRPLEIPVNSDRALREAGLALLTGTGLFEHPVPIRLIGFGAGNLQEETDDSYLPRQLSLFSEENLAAEAAEESRKKDKALDQAVDTLRAKFGTDSLTRGTMPSEQ